jgi:hypothetical protein
MKLTGFLLLAAGWLLVLAAISLLPPGSAETVFILVAMGVEALGLTLVFRAHLTPLKERR